MTIGATAVKEENRSAPPRIGWMTANMALRAEPRISDFQQPVVNRSVRLMAVGAVFERRRMLIEKRAAPFRVALVTGFIDACPFKLRWVGRAVWVVAVRADNFSLSQGHVRRTQQLSFPLQMALTANLNLGSIDEERRHIGQLRHLLPAGFLHQRMAVHASKPSARMRARLPVGLDAALMTAETGFVLNRGGFTRVFTKCDQPANAAPAARGDVVASRTVTTLTSPFLSFGARVEEENFPHHGLGKFLELFGVASLANFVADVCSRRFFAGFLDRFFRGFFFRRPSRTADTKQKHTQQRHEKNSSHDCPVSYSRESKPMQFYHWLITLGKKKNLSVSRPISYLFAPSAPCRERAITVAVGMTSSHAQAIDRSFDAITDLELAQNIFEVSLDRGGADPQARSDLTIGHRLGNQRQHASLSSC